MASRYENHQVVATFGLGIKSEILAVSTFIEKIKAIQRKFRGSFQENLALVLKEFDDLLIEEILNDDERRLVVKGMENVQLQLIACEPVTHAELIEKKLNLISKINSINFLKDALANGELTYDQLERVIQKTSNPHFLKKIIRSQYMPYIEIDVDQEIFKIQSFEIPREWHGGKSITLTNYNICTIDKNGDVVLSVPESELHNKHIHDDPLVVVKVDPTILEYQTLKLAFSMHMPVTVDLMECRKVRKSCPYFKLIHLHHMDQILENMKSEVADFQEKLSYL